MESKNQLNNFLYTAEQLVRLERSLSSERMAPYIRSANGDKTAAIRLYEWNTTLSGSLYCVLQGLEVAVRNAMHRALSTGFDGEDWYNCVHLEFSHAKDIQKVKQRLMQERKPLDAGRVIAELAFGFWVGLIGPRYVDSLWIPHLHRAFPNKPQERKSAHGQLDRIRKLRNRVAHHEPILNRNMRADFHQILDTLQWICPDTARWVQAYSTFLRELDEGPRN